MFGLPWWQIVLAILIMATGSAIQGAVGFGSNVFAAPLLVLFAKSFVPAPVILASLVLNSLMVHREGGHAQWKDVRWPAAGLIPGSIAGAGLLTLVSQKNLAWVFGPMVLVAVAMSISGLHPKPTRHNLLIAGTLSGFMGTSVGISGPPIALVYQKESGKAIRATLSRFFLAAGVVSLIILGFFGKLHLDVLWTRTLILLPGTFGGFYASSFLAPRLDKGKVRAAVLAVSAASGLIAIIQAVYA